MTNRPLTLPIAIGAITLAGLMLEIGLTRLFSVLFFPPAVFAILSLAILGIGLGAALVTSFEKSREPAQVPLYLGMAGICVVLISAVSAIPNLQLSLFGLVVMPYLFIGMALTTLFSHHPQRSTQLYLADLTGAGLGAVLAVPLLNWLGGLNGVLMTAVLLALAGLVLSNRPMIRFPIIFVALTVLGLTTNLVFSWLEINMGRLPAEKPIGESLPGNGVIIESRWDAFARTDLVDPGNGEPYRLYMDGAAGSVMPPDVGNDFLFQDIGFFSFATEQPERVFLIGPGGGLDVWFALQSGAGEIMGVEVNPASVALVQDYADYNGNIYGRSNVTIIVDDGRSVLQRNDSQYDLIFLSQLVTLAAERNGYALVENSAFTVEAFGEYLDHLTPSGQLSLKLYDEPTLTRALSTALAALRRRGLTTSDQEGLRHTIALLDGNSQPPIPLLIVRPTPFTREDSLSLGAVAQQVGFTPLFLPEVIAQPPLDRVATGEISFAAVVADSDNDLSPTTDNRPFFYQFERGIPQTLQPLLIGAIILIVLSAGLVIIYQRRVFTQLGTMAFPLYFAGLGLGFILIEIGIIQKTRLFLGHPTTATTVVLATLLIGGGVGSGLGGRIRKAKHGFIMAPLLMVIVFLALWLLLWPVLETQFLGMSPYIRVLIVIITIIPLGLVMGIPFPLGLQEVAGWDKRQVALAWSVNGLMSVLGSIFAVALAIQFGFTYVLLIGGAAYGLAAVATYLAPIKTSS